MSANCSAVLSGHKRMCMLLANMVLNCMKRKTRMQQLFTYWDPGTSKSPILVCSLSFLLTPNPCLTPAVCPCFTVAMHPPPPPPLPPSSLQPEELTLLLIKLRRQQAELNSIREHTVAQLMQLNMDGDNPKVRPPGTSLQACMLACGVYAIFFHFHYPSRSGGFVWSSHMADLRRNFLLTWLCVMASCFLWTSYLLIKMCGNKTLFFQFQNNFATSIWLKSVHQIIRFGPF